MTTSCPYCGSGEISYDPSFRYAACNNCGGEFQVKDYDPDWELPFDVEKVECHARVGKPYGHQQDKKGWRHGR